MIWTAGMGFVAGINDGTHDISACAAYRAGYGDWRAPNVNEMASLLNVGDKEIKDRATRLLQKGIAQQASPAGDAGK